jgi:hypothetical protein
MSTIVLNTLNYVGEGVNNAISLFRETSAGLVNKFRTLTNSVTLNKQRVNVKWKLVLPFPPTDPVSCPCEGEAPFLDTIVDINVRMDPRADSAYRTDVQVACTDLAASVQFKDSIKVPKIAT